MPRKHHNFFSQKSNQVTIHKAHRSDKEQIKYVAKLSYEDAFNIEWKDSYNKPLLKDINQKNCIFLVAKINNEVVGYLKLMLQSSSHALLSKIYILPSKQGLGIGSQLMNEALKQAYHLGIVTCELAVWEENKAAIHFYEKYHFKKHGQVEYIAPNGEPSGVMDDGMVCHDISLNLDLKVAKAV